MNIKNDDTHYQFCLEIIKSLHLEPTRFFRDIGNNREYECLIYFWIDTLYTKEISVEESIDFIHKARHLLFFYGIMIITPDKKKYKLNRIDADKDIPLYHFESNKAS